MHVQDFKQSFLTNIKSYESGQMCHKIKYFLIRFAEMKKKTTSNYLTRAMTPVV
jgi:hypothetical protein